MESHMNHFPFAAVLHAGNSEGDALIRQFCGQLQASGWKMRGLLPLRGKDPQGRLPMLISDIRDGRSFAISQALGPGSHACSLDPGALAQAGSVLREALDERPDLVIVNRFGAVEAAGRGFASDAGSQGLRRRCTGRRIALLPGAGKDAGLALATGRGQAQPAQPRGP